MTKDVQVGSDDVIQTINRYSYALNNPLRLSDVSGYSAKEGQVVFGVNVTSDLEHVYLVDLGVANSTPKVSDSAIPGSDQSSGGRVGGSLGSLSENGQLSEALTKEMEPEAETSGNGGWLKYLPRTMAEAACDYFALSGCSIIGNTVELGNTVEEWVPVMEDMVLTPKDEEPSTAGGHYFRGEGCMHLKNDEKAYLDCVLGPAN